MEEPSIGAKARWGASSSMPLDMSPVRMCPSMGMPRVLVALLALSGAIVAGGCGSGGGSSVSDPPGSLAPMAEPGGDLTVAAAGDFGMERGGVATFEEMASSNADIYLGVGDFSYAGPGTEDEFCDLVHSKLGAGARFEIVAGNHEEDTGEDGRMANYAACLPDRAGAVGEYGEQYYFDVGGLVRFVMISPDLTIDGDHYYYGRGGGGGGDTPQLAWLKQTIDEARAAGTDWIVVGMHKNCISVGEYYCDVYQDLFSTLISEGVDLVISGHDHTYQRSKQIGALRPGCEQAVVDEFDPDCVIDGGDAYRKGAGTVFVIAGTGGAELYPVDHDDPEAGYFAATMGKNTTGARHGFALLTITPRRFEVRFMGSTPGLFADRFSIADGLSSRD
jgi:Calcineurin-like phosphoesterase